MNHRLRGIPNKRHHGRGGIILFIARSGVGMPEHTDYSASLTPRETDVLRLVARGRTAKQIAPLLGMTTSTVQHHLNHIRAKLGAKNNAHLVALALRAGLIEPEDDSP